MHKDFHGTMDKDTATQTAMDENLTGALTAFLTLLKKEEPRFHSAYLFGSFARGNQHQDSDVDVAVVMDGLSDEERFQKQVQLISTASLFNTRIEPHPISTEDFMSENPFAIEIRRTAIPLAA